MSPKEARDFLKPLVPTFAMLLLVNASSVVAAFNPFMLLQFAYDLCFVFFRVYSEMRLTSASAIVWPSLTSTST